MIGVAVAVATALAAGAWITGLFAPRAERPELSALFAALGEEPTRPVSGRISGLSHGRRPTAQRGARGAEISPEVEGAVAKLDQIARAEETARNNAALGVARLALGDSGRAVELLEDAVFEEPASAVFQNDLAAAYLARAAEGMRPEDWAAAIAAADRAIARDPRQAEAHFNRALAFDGLHMSPQAIEAWRAYESVDPSGAWHAEATAAREALERRQQILLAAAQASPDNQTLREHVEDDLLPKWGAAIERGDVTEAVRLLAESERIATQVASADGDAMARDQIALIGRLQAAGDRRAVGRLASGHRLFGEARTRYAANERLDASNLMAQAASHFGPAGSPYRHWAPIYRALHLRTDGRSRAALDALHAAEPYRDADDYRYLRGRRAWVEALALETVGRYDTARSLTVDATRLLREAGEHDSEIAALTQLAETEWFLGERPQAWVSLASAFEAIDRRGTTERFAHLGLAATMALGAGLPEAALAFHDARVMLPSERAGAHLQRARTRIRVGDSDAAASDLEVAASLEQSVAPRGRRWIEIEIARAELSSTTDCLSSLAHARRALPRLERADGTIRRAALLTVMARCYVATGDVGEAQARLLEAIDLFEARRDGIALAERTQAFELERAAYRELLRLHAVTRGDEAAALRVAERARTGTLAEAWGETHSVPAHTALPADVAVVYYEVLDDRVLVWVLTREGRTAFDAPVGEAHVRQSVSRIRRAIDRGADLARLRTHSAGLYQALVAPALAKADATAHRSRKTRVVFVPDGPLFGLPFNALPDDRGRPLIEARVVATAPSLATFLAASSRLGDFSAGRVLAVGDGHEAASTGLPHLPGADAEAEQVARLYPERTVLTGARATRQRFLQAPADVIHFAGHSVVNEPYPLRSRMLLAPDPASGDPGLLFGSEISSDRFRGTGVVVLATCDGASGRPVEGEGAMSLARAFLGAGVPAVVANLWPADDDLQTLMETFHTTLRTERDPATALRAAQRAILRERGANTPVRVWGGFTLLGGLAPHSGNGG